MMHIDTAAFTPSTSLLGGILIGLAAVGLVLFNGRIAGISGIVGGLLAPKSKDIAWRVAFVLGLLLAPWAYTIWAPLPEVLVSANDLQLACAGVLVGLGTRYASGCTSGHGVCGLSRLSVRSLVATLCFMGAGFMTVFALRHLLHI